MRVVSGLLAQPDGRVLMGLRRAHKLRPSLWELPGGKVDDGECDATAIIREWREELGVEIRTIGGPLAESHMDVEVSLDIVLYRVVVVAGSPKQIDHEQILYCMPSFAVRYMPCSPGFYLQYRAIQEASGEMLP